MTVSEVQAYWLSSSGDMLPDPTPDSDSWCNYDAAQAELAALREELAGVNRSFDELAEIVGFSEARLDQAGDSPMDCATQLQQRLTAAEQRNAFLEAQISAKDIGIVFRDAMISAVSMSEDTALMAWVPSDWEAKRRTLLSNSKPTKSGASVKCLSDGGTCGLGGQCHMCPHKESGASEPQCLLCLDAKTVPGNIPGGFVKDCPDCCGEEG